MAGSIQDMAVFIDDPIVSDPRGGDEAKPVDNVPVLVELLRNRSYAEIR